MTLALMMLAASGVLARPGVGRPVHLEGHWSEPQRDKGVIGVITVCADGKEKRSFVVTALETMEPEEEGIVACDATERIERQRAVARGDTPAGVDE